MRNMSLKNAGIKVQLLLSIIRLVKYSIPTSLYIQVEIKEDLRGFRVQQQVGVSVVKH